MTGRFIGLTAGVVLGLLLAGCGGEGDAPEAGNDGSGGITVSTPTAVPTVTVSPGKVKVTEGLPPGFPDDIPLYDAPVLAGTAGEPGSRFDWSVVLQPSSEPSVVARAAAALFEDAGFTAGAAVDQPTLQVLEYSNASYVVGVTVVKTGDGITMTYTVSRK